MTKDQLMELLQEKVEGHRKGQPNTPNWVHSMRVYDILRSYRYDDATCLAGGLHDLIEDGGMTRESLADLGVSPEVVHAVALVSHSKKIEDSRARWFALMQQLSVMGNKMTWLVKVADIIDNIRDSDTLSEENAWFMVNVKRPVILMLSKDILKGEKIWSDLFDTVA